MKWHTDILGDDFEACTYQATGADGLERTATLVRHAPNRGPERPPVPRPLPRRAILFLHGWSDYFFNVELAQFWTDNGFEFFALDMHNHGRSLQPDTPGGFVADLDDYDAEIGKAIGIIGSLWPEEAGRPSLTLMGHSTGGLVAALWVSRHPGVAAHLVLNSPWLEMHGSSLVRRAARSMVGPLARYRPEAVLRLPERGFYWRSISSEAEGEWTLDNKYRPPMAFPVRAGWLRAVLAGHSRVARGLRIDIPILVLLSGASQTGMFWTEAMRSTDAVLDVNTIAIRAMALGRSVTLERIDGALHDVFLSPAHVRADAYARLSRWIRGYILEEGGKE
ncbi:alpha/beta hydrolase [Arthrobacter oryzae]|jgi:alpha-beta hydrolase superfamily lysophospholipase|uniref:alpha/beta hydrolase n=1 Tax=Arthrobacter oryzae TaxID=409290 RepID=UPI002783A2D4|nr:alpha/beta hydrolase [Arthrobacter oryzae]MDQ0075928.1 alpha-beta hydrolase superfamily lysophospholipase [Arthrobacter oryzae]